jgi:hypothetical protein
MRKLVALAAFALLVGTTGAYAQEPEKAAPADQMSKPAEAAAKTAMGTVKSASATSLVVSDKDGKDWTFVVDSSTKIVTKAGYGKKKDDTATTPAVTSVADLKEGAKVTVRYHETDGKMHAATVRLMPEPRT